VMFSGVIVVRCEMTHAENRGKGVVSATESAS
jgi:hypothetical protein